MSAAADSTSFSVSSARAEFVLDNLEALATSVKMTSTDLVAMVDEYVVGKTALVRSVEKYVTSIYGKLIPAEDLETAVHCGRTVLLALQACAAKKISVNLGDIISVDPLTMGLLLQTALSTLTKPTSSPDVVLPGSFIEYADLVPQLLLKAFKSTITPWKSITLHSESGDIGVRARSNGTVNHRVLAVQLLQSFRGMSSRAIVEYLSSRANEMAGSADAGLSPLADALTINDNLLNINSSGRFNPGFVSTMSGSVGTAACILKDNVKQYGPCCVKHLPMGLALIPTGPFCISHVLSDSPASSIAFHAFLTLSLFHMMSVVYASSDEGQTVHPKEIETLAQGYTPAGDSARLTNLVDRLDGMAEDVKRASARVSSALGELFKSDCVTYGGLSTVSVTNGITAHKVAKNFPVFVQESIAARCWYLRMLNLVNGGEKAFVPANFTRANIIRRVFGSSTLLAMVLNFNTNPAVITETLSMIQSVFADTPVSSLIVAGESLQSFSPSGFVETILANNYNVPATPQEGPVRLETAFGVTMVKPASTGKIPAANIVVFTHGPVVYGTGFVAAPRATKAISSAQDNSDFFQTPIDELRSVLDRITQSQAEKASAKGTAPKPAGKRTTKAGTTASATSVGRRAQEAANVTVTADDVDLDGVDFDDIPTSTTRANVATKAAPASELRQAHRSAESASASAPKPAPKTTFVDLDDDDVEFD